MTTTFVINGVRPSSLADHPTDLYFIIRCVGLCHFYFFYFRRADLLASFVNVLDSVNSLAQSLRTLRTRLRTLRTRLRTLRTRLLSLRKRLVRSLRIRRTTYRFRIKANLS